MTELINQVRALFSQKVHDKGLQFDVQVPPNLPQIVLGDAARIQQVLANLLNNSLKFTSAGGIRITVSSEDISLDHCLVTIAVQDSGKGMDLLDQNKLFTEFYSSPDSVAQGGTGLGLVVCKQLVMVMGGSIHFQSEPGKGSTFWFSLPMEMKQGGQETTGKPSFQARGRILVVDDNPVNLKVMAHYLKQAGCSPEFAINGEEAVEMAAKNNYDVIFMDIQMPVKDGFTATKEIRSNGKKVPIVAVSASMESERAACLVAGMDAYITKPIDKHQLNEILQQYCKKRAQV